MKVILIFPCSFKLKFYNLKIKTTLDKKLSNFLSTQLNTQSSMLQLTNQLNENGLIDKKTKKIFENLDKGIKQLISKNKK